MKTVLITGGHGDIAVSLKSILSDSAEYLVYSPSHKEMNVSNIEEVSSYINNIENIDVLINNAGINIDTSILNSDISIEKTILETNLFGAFNCTNAVLKKNKNAFIINIGSMSGTAPGATYNSYRAAKAGLIMATKCWAMEGVNTICINVGRLKGKMRQKLFPKGDPYESSLLKKELLSEFIKKIIDGKINLQNGLSINVHSDNIDNLLKGIF